jgi:His/Glu/Gln/Arg/opine family amino acid ABC transporter permease subunit
MTRRGWLWAAGFFLVAAALGFYLLSEIGASGLHDDGKRPLTCAIDAEGGAPYIFKDPKDPEHYLGFEADIAQALSRELHRPIELKQYEFSSIFAGLGRGDFDMSISGLEITPDRLEKFRFSRPYYIYKLQLVSRADEKRFHSLADCAGRNDITIGTLEDTAAERLLDKMGIKKRIYPGQVEPYSDCALGRIDGVLLDWPIAIYHGNKDPKLHFAGPPIEPGYYAVALAPSQNGLKPQLDEAIDRLVASGELQKIYEKWKLWTPDQVELSTDKVRNAADADALGETDEHSQWTFRRYAKALGLSALVTINLTLQSMALAMAIGLTVALMRLYGPAPLRWLGLLYVEFFRGIPVILLLYFLYYGLPGMSQQLGLPLSLNLNPLYAAILGLGLNYAAYESEIYRAGIGAIPVGQWEAAASLGMPAPLTFLQIILPQALRLILPPMTNDFVALFKDTSVVSVIAVVELSKEYQILSKSSLKYLEIGLATAALYLIMSVPLGHLSRYMEKRWSGEQ